MIFLQTCSIRYIAKQKPLAPFRQFPLFTFSWACSIHSLFTKPMQWTKQDLLSWYCVKYSMCIDPVPLRMAWYTACCCHRNVMATLPQLETPLRIWIGHDHIRRSPSLCIYRLYLQIKKGCRLTTGILNFLVILILLFLLLFYTRVGVGVGVGVGMWSFHHSSKPSLITSHYPVVKLNQI